MARSKRIRRARAGLFLAVALLILWLLDLGGLSPKEGQREQKHPPHESDASQGAQGAQEARKGEVEESAPQEEEVGTMEPGPVQEPSEDLIEGRRAAIERMLRERDFQGSRAWIAAQASSTSKQLRKMAGFYGSKLAGLGEAWETGLRTRLQELSTDRARFEQMGSLEESEREVADFARDFPERSAGLLADLPEDLGRSPSEAELARWSQDLSRSLPVEVGSGRRLVRLFRGEAVLRVPGTAGGFRHERRDLVSLPPALLLRLAPAAERKAVRSFLARLYLEAGLRVSANWLWFGQVELKPRVPGPGR